MQPAIHANMTHSLMRAAALARPGAAVDIRERLGTAFCARLDAMGATDWLPLADHLTAMEAARAVLGDPGLHELGRRITDVAIDLPMFNVLVPLVGRLAGSRAVEVLRFYPQGWELASRGAGRVQVVMGTGRTVATVRIVGLPPSPGGYAAMAAVVAGSLERILERFGMHVRGTATPAADHLHVLLVRADLPR